MLPECDSQLVADRGVRKGGEAGGVPAVDPALLEAPQRAHDQVVPPLGRLASERAARLQVDRRAREADAVVGIL